MKCVGKFKFKGLTKKDGGSFTNDRGQVIQYKESYSLKVDENTEKGIYERTFKVASDSSVLDQLMKLQPYQDITLEFDINIYGSRITVVPVAIKQ